MAEPFLSEIRIFSFDFPPKGWAFCNGQFLPINQNQALFALLGTTYGGNGQTTFALPNLKGRLPIHTGNGHTLGEAAGSSAVTINQQTMPQHIHFMQGTTAAAVGDDATNNVLAQAGLNAYAPPAGLTAMGPASVTNVGGSQPHSNMMPYLVLNFCIALQGIFPSQN
jgi:microcystin-dependent protein